MQRRKLTIRSSMVTLLIFHSCYNVKEESEKIAFGLNLIIEDDKNSREIYTKNWNDEIGPDKVKSPLDINVLYKNKITKGKLKISEQNV